MLEIAVVLNAMIVLGLWLGILGALAIIAVNESYSFFNERGKIEMDE